MLRTGVFLVLVVVLLAACGRTTDDPVLAVAEPVEVVAQAGPGLQTWHPQPPPPPTTTTVPPLVTTTTTHPPSPRVQAQSVSGSGTVNGYPCGGALPTCRVLACESGGDPSAQNPTSSASGLWQILDSTWDGFGGYARALHAPWQVQNEKAVQLWAGGAGQSHWKACL